MRYGAVRPAYFEIQQRHIVVQTSIVRMPLDLSFVAVNVLSRGFSPEFTGQRDEIGLVSRQYLNPQIAHFVRRVLAPSCAFWRTLRIAGVVWRVVVYPPHRERRAFREMTRLFEPKDVMP